MYCEAEGEELIAPVPPIPWWVGLVQLINSIIPLVILLVILPIIFRILARLEIRAK